MKDLEREALLRQWSASHNVESAIPACNDLLPELSQGALLPVGLQTLPLVVLEWPCPAREIASKMLAGMTRKDNEGVEAGGVDRLIESWEKRCQGFQTKYCRPCTTRPERQKVCFIANRCLCEPESRTLLRFVREFVAALCCRGGLLTKGGACRALYNASRLCFRLYRKHSRDDVRPKDIWIHVSFGNLATSFF